MTFANMYGSILMLAQDGAMPLGGAGGGETGTAGGGTGGTTAPPAMLDSFLPMVLLFVVVIIVFTWISQRKGIRTVRPIDTADGNGASANFRMALFRKPHVSPGARTGHRGEGRP